MPKIQRLHSLRISHVLLNPCGIPRIGQIWIGVLWLRLLGFWWWRGCHHLQSQWWFSALILLTSCSLRLIMKRENLIYRHDNKNEHIRENHRPPGRHGCLWKKRHLCCVKCNTSFRTGLFIYFVFSFTGVAFDTRAHPVYSTTVGIMNNASAISFRWLIASDVLHLLGSLFLMGDDV